MTKIDIISGFLGAGKTTLIKRLLKTGISNEQVVLVENEFGEIGIDAGFLKETKIDIKELNQGCICCSLQGDFATALTEIMSKFSPDRIIIEPSGVGKLSDIVKAVVDANLEGIELNALACVCDANKAKMYLKNFGEFYIDQVKHAKTVFLSRSDVASEEKMQECLQIVRDINPDANIVTTSINDLSDDALINAYEAVNDDFEESLLEEVKHMHHHHHHEHDHDEEECCCGHHHEHDHDEEECCCGHHHEHDHDEEECCCGHHHEHDHDEEECCCGHHHEHDHDEEECCCGHHHEHDHDEEECCCGHHHEHDHDADEVFTSYGFETAHKYTKEELESILKALTEDAAYGVVLRAKGIVDGVDGWYYFDMVPEEADVRHGLAASTGKVCVIGSKLCKEKIKELFIK